MLDFENTENEYADGKFSFKLLTDEVAVEDEFADKTHQRIAETLKQVIEENDDGVTIALEGSWGSGKSTVISLFKNLIHENKDIHLFYFDAWAHEGDHLRRVFIQRFFSKCKSIAKMNGGKIDELEKKIISREKRTRVTTKNSISPLGSFMTISGLLIPFGVAMISLVDKSKLVLFPDLTLRIYYEFVIGMICCFAWILVLAFNLVYIRCKGLKVLDWDNWRFITQGTELTESTQVDEGGDQSSIDFENDFQECLEIINSKSEDNKVVLVVDNLDRIDVNKALNVWGTIQVFVQKRNSEGNDDVFKKLWVLVPFDQSGMEKLWENARSENNIKNSHPEEAEQSLKGNIESSHGCNCAKSFFEKCFQLRLEVPPFTISNWEEYFKEKLECSFAGMKVDEKESIFDIFKLSRNSIHDVPTPREVKVYINQVGLLKLNSDKDISIKSISYYVILRFIRMRHEVKIREILLGESFLDYKLKPYFHNVDYKKEMCGLLFGVSPDKGAQMFLSKEITGQLLSSGEEDSISGLIKNWLIPAQRWCLLLGYIRGPKTGWRF
jgi:energy-coupling factor transporter ATP-binding protein EcfA2